MVNASEILNIVEIIYFSPALLVSLYICLKHGFKREAGWFLLVVLSLMRIVGSSTGLAAVHNGNHTLIEVSLILNSIGSATLVAAFTGITNRIADGSKGSPFSTKQRKLLQIIGILAIVLGIVGGTNISETNTSSDYLKAAAVLILIQLLASTFVLGSCGIHFRQILDTDRKLFFCVSLAVPFLFVRTMYSILAAFDSNSSTFSLLSSSTRAVIVRACLATAMEIISTSLFILAGLVAPKIVQGERPTSKELPPYAAYQSQPQHGVTMDRY